MKRSQPEMVPIGGMMLMPPKPGMCRICAGKHGPREAHNAQSPYYQVRFKAKHGRWPTWADAIAHCEEDVQAFWRNELGEHWTEPAAGVKVIAEVMDD